MGTSAAISGVLAAAIPALFAMAAEGLPGWRKGVGFLIAGVAIWLIAAGDAAQETRSATWLAIGAGAGFGVYFVMLKFAATGGAVWPAATSRIGSFATCAIALLLMRGVAAAGITRRMLLWVGTTVLFDTGGNLFFLMATRLGRLDVAAVLAAMYPVGTILLAAWRTHERPTRRQGWGMAVAGVAVVLIAG
jgi:drug/metabolite transporter (DMT)-like permease